MLAHLKIGLGKLWVKKVWAQNILIHFLAELDHSKIFLRTEQLFWSNEPSGNSTTLNYFTTESPALLTGLPTLCKIETSVFKQTPIWKEQYHVAPAPLL